MPTYSHDAVRLKQQYTYSSSLYMDTFRRSKRKIGIYVYRVLSNSKQAWAWYGQTTAVGNVSDDVVSYHVYDTP